jgi:hypothetical protein
MTTKNLEDVWRWKEEIAKETEKLTVDQQLEYFHRVTRDFMAKATPPLNLPVVNVISEASSQPTSN